MNQVATVHHGFHWCVTRRNFSFDSGLPLL